MEESSKIAIVNSEGNILCIVDGGYKFLPLDDVTLENLFIFWSKDLEELRDTFYCLFEFNPDPVLFYLNLEDLSLLEIIVDPESEDFWFS